MKKIYIITGANGFLGNNIVRKLENYPESEIRALVFSKDKIKSLKGLNCQIFYGDVTKKETLNDIFTVKEEAKIIVIHCAAIVYIKNKPNPAVFDTNVVGTKNIIDKCLETKARLIYVNSVHAIPEPNDNRKILEVGEYNKDLVEGIYAKSKAEAAQMVLNYVKSDNLQATIVQPSGIIGPGDYGMTHMTRLILDLANQKLPAIVNGGYDFVDVRDVVDGIIASIDKGKIGESYILANRYITIKEIAEEIYKYINVKKIPRVLPISFVKIIAPILEIYYNIKKEVPLFTKYSLYTLQAKANFSHEKASRELGYKTRSLKETITDTIEWFIEVGRIKINSNFLKEYEDEFNKK